MGRRCVGCNKKVGLFARRVRVRGGWVCAGCFKFATREKPRFGRGRNYTLAQINEVLNPAPLELVGATAAEKLAGLAVPSPGIVLKPGEKCFYVNDRVESYNSKVVSTGSQWRRSGTSVRIAKGITYHSGTGRSQIVRQEVYESYPGQFVITSARVILLAPKFGFDVPLHKITQVSPARDGLSVHVGGKCHRMLTFDAHNMAMVIQLCIEAGMAQAATPSYRALPAGPRTAGFGSPPGAPGNNMVSTLCTLKGLVDEGVLTKDEFAAAKKRLLG